MVVCCTTLIGFNKQLREPITNIEETLTANGLLRRLKLLSSARYGKAFRINQLH